jgi:cytochrome P450
MADDDAQQPPAFAKSGAAGEWIACRCADVQAVLADDRFEVPEADAAGRVGTISWLRASVSRFANGPEHRRRRAGAVAELRPLEPDQLRRAARWRTDAAITATAKPGERLDVMALLARRVPMTVMAECLGIACAEGAAEAVIAIAAGYFPGSDPRVQQLADAATARLVDMLGPAEMDVTVARIALMVQGCDATAGLIGLALEFLQGSREASADWPTHQVLDEVLRHNPVVRASRRIARAPVSVNGSALVGAGDTVVCNVEAANRDLAASGQSDSPDLSGHVMPSLTFGYGIRPCPGAPQALALATGVVDAVREACSLLSSQRVEYEPSPALRIPRMLEVVLR